MGQDCMEKFNLDAILRPSYQIYNKPCTSMEWPINAGLMITKVPATTKDGYSKGYMAYIANRAYYSLDSNSLAFIIVSSYKEEKIRPFEVIEQMVAAGFKFIDFIIWIKNKYIPTQGNKRLNNVFDFVLMFSKGDNYHLNRESVAFLKNRLDVQNDNEYLCAGNVWKIKIDDREFVPYELIECLIRVANLLPNTLIIDPIMGNGTTLKVSLDHTHSFWGCESDKLRYDQCKKVIREFNNADQTKSEKS